MGRVGVVNAEVSLTLQIIHTNGTRSLLTEGFTLLMTDDGFGGTLLSISIFLASSVLVLQIPT